MAISPGVLVNSKQAENVQTTQYTTPSGARTRIDKFTATNTGAANASLSVWLVNAGGTAGNANLIVSAKFLTPGETYLFPELITQWLVAGQFIVTQASAATTLTIRVCGTEFT